MVVVAANWSFMREWWRILALSQLLQVTTTARHDSLQVNFRSMDIHVPRQGRHAKSRWLQQRDALELVLLQLTADQRAFMEMAREFCFAEEGTDTVWGDFHVDAVIPCVAELIVDDQYADEDDPT